MAGFVIQGGASNSLADVDAANQLKVVLSALDASTGNVGVGCEIAKSSSGYGSRVMRFPWASPDNRLSTGQDTPIGEGKFTAAVQNTALTKCLFTTTTITQGSGSVLFNANNTLTTATGCMLQTWQHFPLQTDGGLRATFIVSFSQASVPANQEIDFGLGGGATQTTTPTDGVFFQITSAGTFVNIVYSAAGPVQIGPMTAPIAANQSYEYGLRITARAVEVYRDEVLIGFQALPAANGTPFVSGVVPAFWMTRNTSAVGSTATQLKAFSWAVSQLDVNVGKDQPSLQSMMGKCAYQGQEGDTIGSTALYTQNLAAGTGVAATNTTAALGSGLGGQFSLQPTLVAGTDGIISSFQNPAWALTAPAKTLLVYGVSIMSVVTTALTGGPVIAVYSLAFGHTAVSLATVETGSFVTATTKLRRAIALGIEVTAATAVVGTMGSANGITRTFKSPIPVNPGEFVQVCMKNLGTVTSAGVIVYTITIDAVYA
jgi:hypothetical protein